MRAHEAYELSHQFVVEAHAVGAVVHGAGLRQVPVVDELHHVVVPADVRLNNLARARVADVRTVGVGDGRGQVADYREAGVLEAHAKRVGILGPLLGADGVLPAGLLEGHLPVVDAHDQVLAPLLRRGRVDVVNDRLLGFHQLAAFHALGILGALGLQAPACGHGAAAHLLLAVAELAVALGEITYARVEVARAHRLFRQQHERCVQAESGLPRQRAGQVGLALCSVACGISLHGLHLGVDGVGAHAVDIALVGLQRCHLEAFFRLLAKGCYDVVAAQEISHADARVVAVERVAALFVHFEAGHDGVLRRSLQGTMDLVGAVGRGVVGQHAQQHLLAALLEIEHVARHQFAAIDAQVHGRSHEARSAQERAPQQRVGNLEIVVVLVLLHVEQTLHGCRPFLLLFGGFGSRSRFILFLSEKPCLGRSRQQHQRCHNHNKYSFHNRYVNS